MRIPYPVLQKIKVSAERDPRVFPMLLDLRGLNCPLPVLRTRKMLRRLAHGARLIIECTDPLTIIDIPNLVRETGDTLEHHEATNGLFIFHIKRVTE